MFQQIATVYDLVKSHRDYRAESDEVVRLAEQYVLSVDSLLEVACGTGSLLEQLPDFRRIGLDVSREMLDVARQKLPAVEFHCGNMVSFKLPRQFSVVLCLDGAIGYNAPALLRGAMNCMAEHMLPGGLLLIEPWYSPETWKPHHNHVVHHANDDITVVRMAHGFEDGSIEFHNLVGDAMGINHFVEKYKFWLYATAYLLETLKELHPDLAVRYLEPSATFKRGLIMATRSYS